MKNVYEVLRQKEMELTRLEKEVEALRLVAPAAVGGEGSHVGHGEAGSGHGRERAAADGTDSGSDGACDALDSRAPQPMRAAGWEDTAKRWP